MLEFGMNPQQALDAPRVYVHYDQKSKPSLKRQCMYYSVIYSITATSFNICIPPASQWLVNLEEGVSLEVAEELRKRGHTVNWPITGTE